MGASVTASPPDAGLAPGLAPFADLSGEGARLYGGRWNSSGRAMVYAASDAALAVLEVRVHLDLPPDLIPDDYVLLKLDL